MKQDIQENEKINVGEIINYPQNKGITLIALVITILFSYDEMIKFSNSKGFLATI